MSTLRSQEKSASPLEVAVAELQDALRVFGLETVGEADPRATDGLTHASPAFMVGYASGAIKTALRKLEGAPK